MKLESALGMFLKLLALRESRRGHSVLRREDWKDAYVYPVDVADLGLVTQRCYIAIDSLPFFIDSIRELAVI